MIDKTLNSELLYCKTVLVVDKKKSILALASELFSAQGYHVLSAYDSDQALTFIESEDVDIFICDAVIPDMSGYELADLVQRYYPQIRIQMINGFPNYESQNDSSLARNSLLHKPYTKYSVAKRLRSLMSTNDRADILSRHTVLVVNESECNRNVFSVNLEKFGCKTIMAHSNNEAVDLYQQSILNGVSIDAVVLDMRLESSNTGRSSTDQLRAIDPSVKTIMSDEQQCVSDIFSFTDFKFSPKTDKYYNSEAVKQMFKQVMDEEQASLVLE